MGFDRPIVIARIDVYPIRARGGVSPKMALGTMPTRPALLLRIEDTSGCYGWGEVWANFPARANIHKAHVTQDVVASHLIGMTFSDPREVEEALRAQLSVYFLHVGQTQVFEHILAGLDCTLWDLALRHRGQSFAEFIGKPQVQANSYATSINAGDLERLIPHHAALGQTHFKLKIGFAEHGCTQIIADAVRHCPDGARVMVDSNQAWTLDQAKNALHGIEEFAPFFAEEPLRADAPLDDWEQLATATEIPLAGGENIYGLEAFQRMTTAGLRVLQPDVAKWGGMSGALALANNVPEDVLIWPHFMGTAVGQIAALSVSAALGDISSCEIDVNENALRTDLCGEVMQINKGCVALPDEPGLVVPPTPESLTKFTERKA